LKRLAELTRPARQMISFIETKRCILTIDAVARVRRAPGIPFSKLVVEAKNKL